MQLSSYGLLQLKLARSLVERRPIRIQLTEDDFLLTAHGAHNLKLGAAAAAHHDAHGGRLTLRDLPQYLMIAAHP